MSSQAETEHQGIIYLFRRDIGRETEVMQTMRADRLGRVYFAELVGTWFLVMVAAGCGVIGAVTHSVPLQAAVVAPALMVGASIYVLGPVSGAHYNPAVTLAFAIRKDFPWNQVAPFWIVQLAGALLAALTLKIMFGFHANMGANEPNLQYFSIWTCMVTEAILTFVLVSIILELPMIERLSAPTRHSPWRQPSRWTGYGRLPSAGRP